MKIYKYTHMNIYIHLNNNFRFDIQNISVQMQNIHENKETRETETELCIQNWI